MKTKYLFGMLLSGAMLAACTADDLNTAPVAQEVNPSAPVFSVSFDDGNYTQNRATYGSDNNVKFEPNKDLLSLFHGTKMPDTRETAPTLTKWQNAIYRGEQDENDNTKFTFTTASMVNPGLAVLVYPAKTSVEGNANSDTHEGAAAPVVTVGLGQDASTKTKTPYMSEILWISGVQNDYKYNGAGEAGYAKTYDILLKRVASTLFLTLNLKEKRDLTQFGVPGIEITKVEMTGSHGESTVKGLFNKSIAIKAKFDATQEDKTVRPAAYDLNAGVGLSWYAASELNFEATTSETGKANTISTTDIDNATTDNPKATFTLLPFDVATQSDPETAVGPEKEDYWVTPNEDMTITVHTNYGKVVLTKESGNIWHGRDYDTGIDLNKTIDAGLHGIMNYLWRNAQSGKFFKAKNSYLNENVGSYLNRNIDVNIKDLDMDGLHIKDEAQLKAALTVYNKIYTAAHAPVTFYLDGDKNGKFTISDPQLIEDVIDQYNNKTNQVVCVPCKEKENGKQCTVVVLENKSEDAQEVPPFTLGKSDDSGTSNDLYQQGGLANVELVGNWKYSDVMNANNGKAFANINTLIVADSLTLVNSIAVAAGEEDEVTLKNGIRVAATGGVGVASTVYAYVPVENFGYMNVSGRLTMVGASAVLTNREAQGYNADGWSKGAVIDVAGRLYVENSQSGNIYNYGVINQTKKGATIYITRNAGAYSNGVELTGNVTKLFNNGSNVPGNSTVNRIGTINLIEASPELADNVKVYSSNHQGFIKIEVDKRDPVLADFGKMANYVVVKGKCDRLRAGTIGEVDYMPSTIKYIEVNVDTDEIDKVHFEGDFTFAVPADEDTPAVAGSGDTVLEAILVRAKNTVHIADGNYVKTKYAYVAEEDANIEFAGEFSYSNNKVGYFGGDASDLGIESLK